MLKEVKFLQALDTIDIEVLFDSLGVQYDLKTDELFIICPNPEHDDTNPSCSININPESIYYQKFSCFGCTFAGSLVKLVETIKDCTYKEAKDYIIEIAESGDNWIVSNFTQRKTIKKPKSDIKITLPDEFVQLENGNGKSYRNYLHSRGLTDRMIENQQWGYCATGRYNKRVVLPVYIGSKLISFYSRHISTKNAAKKVFNATGSRMERALWPYNDLDYDLDYVWITESVFNVVTMMLAGLKNCVCLFGDKVQDEKIKVLSKFKELRIVPDGDYASKTMIENIYNYFKADKIIKAIEMPLREDANSLGVEGLERQLKTLAKVKSKDFRSHLIEIDYSIPK